MVVAVFSGLIVFVSTASAKIAFEWRVGGKALAAGEQQTFTASAESTFDLKTTVVGFVTLLLATKLKFEPGAKIIGGKPGTAEQTVVFEGVTVDKPTGCEIESLSNPVVGTVRTQPLKTEIVEGEISHEPLILITPKTGTIFSETRFLGASCALKGIVGTTTGNLLADPLPHLAEILAGLADFEASQGNEYLLATGEVAKAGLVFAGNAATIGGKALLTLTSDEKFGLF
ncbi:MAG TPA: hypothetical protein VGL68_07255 [Solirubrobacteraceae bacterium]|jgi:hypothetical protein